jgi:hypothetical protein
MIRDEDDDMDESDEFPPPMSAVYSDNEKTPWRPSPPVDNYSEDEISVDRFVRRVPSPMTFARPRGGAGPQLKAKPKKKLPRPHSDVESEAPTKVSLHLASREIYSLSMPVHDFRRKNGSHD